MKVLGISGSLRKASLNTMALRAAVALAPEGMSIGMAGKFNAGGELTDEPTKKVIGDLLASMRTLRQRLG